MTSIDTFDPSQQIISFVTSTGEHDNTTFAALDDVVYYDNRMAISYGAQFGASLVMMIIAVLLTPPVKRKKVVFALNGISLFISALRALFLALSTNSSYVELYRVAANDFSQVSQSATAISIVATIWSLLLTISADLSLVFQTNTLAKTLPRKYYWVFTVLSVLVFFLALGFRLAETITNSIAILQDRTYNGYWATIIQDGALACECAAIWFFSAVFTGSLIWTVRQRRKMGITRWGYLQILAIMGFCTMIIPSIFAILEYTASNAFPEADTLIMTSVAVLLPLSALWAGTYTTSPEANFELPSLRFPKFLRDDANGSPSRQGSTAPIINRSSNRHEIDTPRVCDSPDFELKDMGARSNRTYSAHSDRV